MKRTPLLTLVGGLMLGAILLVAYVATSGGGANAPAAQATAAAAASSGPPAPSPSPTEAPVNAVWAGYVASGTLAISVQDGVAVAYLCDGATIEVWLQGTATGGKLDLTGRDGAALIGSYTDDKATGRVKVDNQDLQFTVETVTEPAGLYRATAMVQGAQVVGGWIVLADGAQVGLVTVDGVTQPAPPLDTANGTVTVDGVELAPTRPKELS